MGGIRPPRHARRCLRRPRTARPRRPGVRALTTRMSAQSPCSTGFLLPVSVQRPPCRRRRCRDLTRWPTAARFGVRERQQERSLHHSRQDPRPLLGRPDVGDQPSWREHRVELRFGRQRAGRSRSSRPSTSTGPAPIPPSSSGNVNPSRPISAQLLPHLRAPAELGVDDGLRFRVVAAAEQLAGRVAQHALFVGEFEVHGRASQSEDRARR